MVCCVSDVRDDFVRGNVGEHSTDAHEAAEDSPDRAGHSYALSDGDCGIGEEAAEALLNILVLGRMALVMRELLEGAAGSRERPQPEPARLEPGQRLQLFLGGVDAAEDSSP